MTPEDTTHKSDWLRQYEAKCAARLALAGYTFGEWSAPLRSAVLR